MATQSEIYKEEDKSSEPLAQKTVDVKNKSLELKNLKRRSEEVRPEIEKGLLDRNDSPYLNQQHLPGHDRTTVDT